MKETEQGQTQGVRGEKRQQRTMVHEVRSWGSGLEPLGAIEDLNQKDGLNFVRAERKRRLLRNSL